MSSYKFKVGDRVKIIENDDHSGDYIGEEATIIAINALEEGSRYIYLLKHTDGTIEEQQRWAASELRTIHALKFNSVMELL